MLHAIHPANCDYIVEHSSLLPLVLANNTFPKIKMYGDNSYMFLCQFHQEHTPSMGVSDWKNLGRCFGCAASFNVVSYLEEYENLTYKEAIQLLAQIYLFDIKKENTGFADIVCKYQESILSQEYLNLLESGQYRLKERHNTKYCGKNIDTWYDAKFQMIERIRNHQYDPEFQYKEPTKVMYLSGRDID